MSINNTLFEQVPLNSRERNACSPADPPLPWRGIVIQAPTQVTYKVGKPVDDRFAAIPICGYYRLDMEKLLDGKPMMLVAIDVKNNTQYSGAVLAEDPGLMEPTPGKPPLDPARVKGKATGAFFNPNLARYVDLPTAAAVYRVHVEYGSQVSNTVQIAVERR